MADKVVKNPFQDPQKYILIPDPAPRHIIPRENVMAQAVIDESELVKKNLIIAQQQAVEQNQKK